MECKKHITTILPFYDKPTAEPSEPRVLSSKSTPSLFPFHPDSNLVSIISISAQATHSAASYILACASILVGQNVPIAEVKTRER